MACWQRVLAADSTRLLEHRIKDLVPYAEAGLAHRLTACFSDFVQRVSYTVGDIEHYAQELFRLDREKDPQDYLIRCIVKHETELKSAQENWAKLTADLDTGDENPSERSLETILNSIEERLSPSLLVKNVKLNRLFPKTDDVSILTFQGDVEAILQEIITGALSTLPDYGEERRIDITGQVRNGQAEVCFSDNLDQLISPEDAQTINGGFSIGPDHGSARFGRAWGLSVMQHIALRGGGRLIVKPQSATRENLITYYRPLAE